MNKVAKLFLIIPSILLVIMLLLYGGQAVYLHYVKDKPVSANAKEPILSEQAILDFSDADPVISEDGTVVVPEPEPVTLMALGDNLMHMGVVYTGKQEDGSLNYQCLYDGVSDFLENANIKIINQETIMAGNQLGFSGYPHFNSPTEVGDSLAQVGFNVVLQSSNHTLDQNLSGLEYCIDFWKTHPDVLMVGIHDQYTEDTPALDRIPLLNIGDYTFAILNYTYGPNSGWVAPDFRGRIDVLCDWNPSNGSIDFKKISPQVLEDISLAKTVADIVIVCPHWGNENAITPTIYQKEFAQQMTAAGADVIIGTHPHVVEPVEWVEAENGNRCLCFYSLGNYVSTQKNPQSLLEAMAYVTFTPTEDGLVIDSELSGAVPLVCQYTGGPVRIEKVYCLENYTPELAAAHGIKRYAGVTLSYDDLKKWESEILGDFVLPLEKIGYHIED